MISRATRARTSADDWIAAAGIVFVVLFLVIIVVFPLAMLLGKSFQLRDGSFAGLANFFLYFSTPALFTALENSITISLISATLTVTVAFIYAYGLTRTRFLGRGLFRIFAQIPLLAPSLLPGIALVYLFGNQGFLKSWLLGHSIYGPIGIVIGEFFWTFPHALIILITALSVADARLYEAAQSLRASSWRIFTTITLPGVKYGLVSAFFVVFTLVITDFGVPKVVGGSYNVLATDVYKQVIGQQNFEMGAVVGIILLLPAVLAFVVDRYIQRKQTAALSARSVVYHPKPHFLRDLIFAVFCLVVSLSLLMIIGAAAFASVVKLWPYNMSLTLQHYDFEAVDGSGWLPYKNTLKLGIATACLGTAVIFLGAYLQEKPRGMPWLRGLLQFFCFIPLAVPGLVLGLSYIFFFNHPQNPLTVIYGTMAILVANTIAHFYTVAHLTAVTALKQIDPEFESVSQSLKVPFYKTFLRVTVPVCFPALLDMFIYLFINSMTTVSALIFIYAPRTQPASVAILNLDDAGNAASAAAMAMVIVFTAGGIRILHAIVGHRLIQWTQGWRSASGR